MLRYKNVIPRRVPNERRKSSVQFRTDERIPASGVYRVIHSGHRLPPEVALLKDQRFPRCQRCAEAVLFEQSVVLSVSGDRRGRIILHELPEMPAAEEPRRSAA